MDQTPITICPECHDRENVYCGSCFGYGMIPIQQAISYYQKQLNTLRRVKTLLTGEQNQMTMREMLG